MLAEKDFEQLLAGPESKTLDFKLEDYDLDKHDKKAAFIKDILAMANTLRDEDSYIILGVKESGGKAVEFSGLVGHQPDERYQQIVRAHADPVPSFQYFQQSYDGKSFGVFQIHHLHQGPFSSKTHFGKDTVREGVIYWRHGSTNAEVTPFDYQHARREWDMNAEARKKRLLASNKATEDVLADAHGATRQLIDIFGTRVRWQKKACPIFIGLGLVGASLTALASPESRFLYGIFSVLSLFAGIAAFVEGPRDQKDEVALREHLQKIDRARQDDTGDKG
jgi:hypothetical protein